MTYNLLRSLYSIIHRFSVREQGASVDQDIWRHNARIAAICLACLCSSCATLMNSRTERIDIHTTQPARVVLAQDTFPQVKNRTKLWVPRSRQPLKVQLLTDSSANTFWINSSNSPAYWLNLYGTYGLGMLVDQNNPKRFSYPSRVFIDPLDPSGTYSRVDPRSRLHDWSLRLYVPYINYFQLQPDGESEIKYQTGFWGLAAGLNFYHQADQFAELTLSTQTSFFVPVPAPVRIIGFYQVADSWHLSLSNVHRLGRFSLGYGLSYSQNTWRSVFLGDFDTPTPPQGSVIISAGAMGLNFPVYYYTGNHFYFSFLYRPSFIRFSDFRPNGYEHLISFGFGWDIHLR